MGVAYYIALDNGDADVATAVDGKVLARATEDLNQLAARIGLGPLDDFFGASAEVLAEFGVDGASPGPWYDAADGVHWFDTLATHIAGNRRSIEHPDEIVAELKDFLAVLRKAQASGAKWHLAVDV
jgi:hypothetical protein